jgi:hypothetical protein
VAVMSTFKLFTSIGKLEVLDGWNLNVLEDFGELRTSKNVIKVDTALGSHTICLLALSMPTKRWILCTLRRCRKL